VWPNRVALADQAQVARRLLNVPTPPDRPSSLGAAGASVSAPPHMSSVEWEPQARGLNSVAKCIACFGAPPALRHATVTDGPTDHASIDLVWTARGENSLLRATLRTLPPRLELYMCRHDLSCDLKDYRGDFCFCRSCCRNCCYGRACHGPNSWKILQQDLRSQAQLRTSDTSCSSSRGVPSNSSSDDHRSRP